MEDQNIRIRLKAFDYRLIDASAKLISETAKKTGAPVFFAVSEISFADASISL